jgi:prophage DNA circulation protein
MLPFDKDGVPYDEGSERASSVEDYKVTCMQFIKDISADYIAWVDYYKLPEQEDRERRAHINAIVERTNEWIAKIATTIKGVDVVMNDGIQKMAESTAGYPFQVGVFVNNMSGYALAKPGLININVKAVGRKENKVKLGWHQKNKRFLVSSTCHVSIEESNVADENLHSLDLHLKMDDQRCKPRDIVSFTVVVTETRDGEEHERRGMTTIIHMG